MKTITFNIYKRMIGLQDVWLTR